MAIIIKLLNLVIIVNILECTFVYVDIITIYNYRAMSKFAIKGLFTIVP